MASQQAEGTVGQPLEPMREADIRPQDLFNQYLDLARRDVHRFFTDRSRFVHVACPACGCNESTLGLEKLGFRYLLCSDCQSLYVSPRPHPEQIHAFYREGESVKFWATDFFPRTAEARRISIFRPRVAIVDEWFRRIGLDRVSPRVLADVGSGYGIFLEEVRAAGSFEDVVGIEPAPDLARITRAKGFRTIETPVELVAAGEVEASVATAFEVFEHLFDPMQFLQAAARVVRPGGLILLTTLTVSGFDIQVLWEHSKSVHPPHHLNLVSVDGMARLVAQAGLELLELCTPGELDVDIVANAVAENPCIPLPRHVQEILRRRDEVLRRDFQRFLKSNKLSSHLRVIARRPLEVARGE